jgi:hypothetical protein
MGGDAFDGDLGMKTDFFFYQKSLEARVALITMLIPLLGSTSLDKIGTSLSVLDLHDFCEREGDQRERGYLLLGSRRSTRWPSGMATA